MSLSRAIRGLSAAALVLAWASNVRAGDDFYPTGPVETTDAIGDTAKNGTFSPVNCGDDDVVRYEATGTNLDNLQKHKCSKPKQGVNPYLPDLFAATCTCPSPAVAMKDVNNSTVPFRAKVAAETKKAVDALANDPEITKEFDGMVSKACSDCAQSFGKTFNDLAECLAKARSELTMADFMVPAIIDGRTVHSAIRKLGTWSSPSDDPFSLSAEYRNIEPALQQSQCEKLGVYSKKGYSANLLADNGIGALKAPFDASPTPEGITRREVRKEIKAAADKASLAMTEAVQPKAGLADPQKKYLKPIIEQAKKWMEAQIRAGAPTDATCAALSGFDAIDCANQVAGVEIAVRRAQNQLDAITLAPVNLTAKLDKLTGAFHRSDKTIEVSPALLSLANTNPEALNQVLAHEVGHAVMNSLQNTYNITEQKLGLFRCLRSQASVGAAKEPRDQLDDSFADWFSTELSAARLGDKPAAARKYAAKDRVLCDGGYAEGSDDAKTDEHPTGPDRMNKITAANPSVRKALGEQPLPAATDEKGSGPLVYCAPPNGLGLNFKYWEKESDHD